MARLPGGEAEAEVAGNVACVATWLPPRLACTPPASLRTGLPRPRARPPTAAPTLGDAAEELELHGQAEQVPEQWDPDALHALLVLLVKPAAAAGDGPVHHVCGKARAGEVPAVTSLEPCPPHAPPRPSQEQRSLVLSSYIFWVDSARRRGGRARWLAPLWAMGSEPGASSGTNPASLFTWASSSSKDLEMFRVSARSESLLPWVWGVRTGKPVRLQRKEPFPPLWPNSGLFPQALRSLSPCAPLFGLGDSPRPPCPATSGLRATPHPAPPPASGSGPR